MVKIQREEYLQFLDSHTHACLVGKPGTGKTSLLLAFSQRLKGPTCYIDFSRLNMSPDQFAIDYVGSLLFIHQQAHLSQRPKFTDITYLKTLDVPGKESIRAIADEFEKKKPQYEKLITLALEFSKKLPFDAIIIDNFDEIESLNNYKEVSDILTLFFHDLPVKVKLSTTRDLKLPIPSKQIDRLNYAQAREQISEEVFNQTQGHPLALAYFSTTSTYEDYLRALITTRHPLHQHLLRIMEKQLSDARGASLLRVVVKTLALHKAQKLTQIASTINRQAPVAKSLLDRLIAVGLVKREGKMFSLSEKILEDFAYYYFTGQNFDEVDEKTLLEVRHE